MIRISETIEIAATPDEVWAIIQDPASVAGCVPGAELTREIEPGLYEAKMSVKFGPTVAHFSGEARVEYDNGARRCTVSGRGNDKRGMSPTMGSGVITLEGEATASLRIDGSFEVSGPLESFVDTGGVFVARALLGQFATNVAELVKNRKAAPDGAGIIPESQPVAPLSAGKLVGEIIKERSRALTNKILGRE